MWSIDFHVDLAALETRELSLRRVDGSESRTTSGRGLSVERAAGKIHVRHPSLQFVVNDDLGGLFERIDVAGDDYLVSGAGGLSLRLRDGRELPLVARALSPSVPGDTKETDAGSSVSILKAGPLAAVLAFEVPTRLTDTITARSTVVLDFPLGKSWVRVDWTIDDPADAIAGVRADLRLRLEADDRAPALADVGANGWTYAALRPGETLAYRAGQSDATTGTRDTWRVDRVRGDRAVSYALPAAQGTALPPQGWAHLMDGTRATAIAVDAFAAAGRDAIELSADGSLRLARDFSPLDGAPKSEAAAKRFTFWLHVVRSPPQVGAATSPQSMQAPPEVRIVPAGPQSRAGQ